MLSGDICVEPGADRRAGAAVTYRGSSWSTRGLAVRARRWWLPEVVLLTVVAAVAGFLVAARPSPPSGRATTRRRGRSWPRWLCSSGPRWRSIPGAAGGASADPTPTCQHPPLPAPTYPNDPSNPGQGYGVPFLAEITGAPITGPLGKLPDDGRQVARRLRRAMG